MKFDNLGWLDVAQGYDISGNSFDRAGTAISHLVIHGTAGGSDGKGTIIYMGNNGVSTHFVISVDGTVWQAVPCSLAAWANAPLKSPRIVFARADINPNLWAVSIEFCKPDITNMINISDAQKKSGFALINFICDSYSIPKRTGDGNGGIISHADINSVDRAHCPGTFPFDELWLSLKGASSVATPPNQYQLADALQEWQSTANLFPGNVAPSFTTGIAATWKERYYRGQRMGAPRTGEVKGTDWAGNPIIIQWFEYARAEWSNGSCRFFDGRGEII